MGSHSSRFSSARLWPATLLVLASVAFPAVSAAATRPASVAPGVVAGTLAPGSAAVTRSPATAQVFGRRRPWYRLRATTFRVRTGTLGARVTGIVMDFNSAYQPVYRCSGTLVDSPNGSVVWTAGHCIFNREASPAPFAHIAFIPGAGPGDGLFEPSEPYGVWWAVRYATTSDWYHHGSARHWRQDLGALLIEHNSRGQTITQALRGADRISFKGTASGNVKVLGYPGEGHFAANDSLIGCGPRPVGRFPFVYGPGQEALGIRCAMTPGASGGPWLTHVRRNGTGTLISVTSSVSDRPGFTYGAVQGREARRVFRYLARRRV